MTDTCQRCGNPETCLIEFFGGFKTRLCVDCAARTQEHVRKTISSDFARIVDDPETTKALAFGAARLFVNSRKLIVHR